MFRKISLSLCAATIVAVSGCNKNKPADSASAPSEKVTARKLAEDIRKKLLAGADFAALAQEYSDDTGSKMNGGNLGIFNRGQMVPEFDEAAFSQNVGDIGEIVETMYGYHIIKVTQKLPASARTWESEKEQLVNIYMGEHANNYIQKLKDDANIEILFKPAPPKEGDDAEDAGNADAKPKASDAAVLFDGEPAVTYAELDGLADKALQPYATGIPPDQMESARDMMKGRFVEQLALKKLLLRACDTEKIEVTDTELDAFFAQNLPPGMTLQDAAAQEGESEEGIRAEVLANMRIQQLIKVKVEAPTDEQLEALFNDIIAQNPNLAMLPERVEASHILIKVDNPQEDNLCTDESCNIEDIYGDDDDVLDEPIPVDEEKKPLPDWAE